jgi:hypothetical protein
MDAKGHGQKVLLKCARQKETLIHGGVGAARAGLGCRSAGGGRRVVAPPALEEGRQRRRLKDLPGQEIDLRRAPGAPGAPRALGALGARAQVVEAVLDELHLLSEGLCKPGEEPGLVLDVELRAHGCALGRIWFRINGAVLAREGVMLGALHLIISLVAYVALLLLLWELGVGHDVCFVSGFCTIYCLIAKAPCFQTIKLLALPGLQGLLGLQALAALPALPPRLRPCWWGGPVASTIVRSEESHTLRNGRPRSASSAASADCVWAAILASRAAGRCVAASACRAAAASAACWRVARCDLRSVRCAASTTHAPGPVMSPSACVLLL